VARRAAGLGGSVWGCGRGKGLGFVFVFGFGFGRSELGERGGAAGGMYRGSRGIAVDKSIRSSYLAPREKLSGPRAFGQKAAGTSAGDVVSALSLIHRTHYIRPRRFRGRRRALSLSTAHLCLYLRGYSDIQR
jgi:hypothetical protein